MAKAQAVPWTREHRLIALNLYFKLPFGRLHNRNPLIVQAAKRMGRTPSSLAYKLSNFASLDPVLKARGIVGLPGVSKADRLLWAEFNDHLETLAPESEQLLHDLFTGDDDQEVDLLERHEVVLEPSRVAPSGPTEVARTVKVRRGQQFFRQSILNAYRVRCCISGINVPRLLVASHIKPWGAFPNERLNLRNGLCLSSLHDAAFDSGLITLDDKLCLVLSKRLRSYFSEPALAQNFEPYEGKPIERPHQSAEPDPLFLKHHRENCFSG